LISSITTSKSLYPSFQDKGLQVEGNSNVSLTSIGVTIRGPRLDKGQMAAFTEKCSPISASKFTFKTFSVF
jgi:hypothetical protein